MNLSKIDIQDELIRHISLEQLVSTHSDIAIKDVFDTACESVPVTYWNKYCGMNNTFTIKADTLDELEEKTTNLLNAIEMYSHCQTIKANGTREGFNMNIFLESSDIANNALHNNYVILEANEHEIDNLEEPVAFFFFTEKELMEGYDKESEEYAERLAWLTSDEDSDYPVNKFSDKLHIDDKCVGDIYQIPASLISRFIEK